VSGLAVSVSGLSKEYQLGSHGPQYGRLTEAISAAVRRRGRRPDTRNERFMALDDVDLEIAEGEVVGIVGRNGAGKTTLLKILSRVTEPTKGTVDLWGRVSALLEVGTGFHPELSGRENIQLNGAILGMSRAEVARKFDEIVEFAEVERFIDTPVKRYSSGMYVRLAFSVAASLEPEVLIIDEVLAVGDARFQKKCLGRMTEVAREGRTVLFVSHNTGAVAELCTRAVLLDHGRKLTEGPVGDVLLEYARLAGPENHDIELAEDPALPVSVTGVAVRDGHGVPSTNFDLVDEVEMSITYRVREPIRGYQIALNLARNAIDVLHTFDTDAADGVIGDEDELRPPGIYVARCRLPAMFLKAGLWSANLNTGTPDMSLQALESVIRFEVEDRSLNTHMRGFRRDRPGHIVSPGRWSTERIG
jgi:lipopolysaccharide transport system ATP-binding protein